MKRLTRFAATLRAAADVAWQAVRPAPDTTEGAVDVGLLLIAGGLFLAGFPSLALLVPGVLLFIVGALPAIRVRR